MHQLMDPHTPDQPFKTVRTEVCTRQRLTREGTPHMDFPDLPHLKQLQKDLWQWPKSRAAVMVGAGLSLNAEPLPGVTTHFPTWRQLVRCMFDELHPCLPGETPEQTQSREENFNKPN